MYLTKEQKKSFEDLKLICEHYLDDNCEAIPSKGDLKRIKRVLGIDIPLVHHRRVEELYRNKAEPLMVEISYADKTYMIGKKMKMFFPFQVKKLKRS